MRPDQSESDEEREVTRQIDMVDAFARRALTSPNWCHLQPDAPHVDTRAVFDSIGHVTQKVRGRKMRDWDGFYDEFASAWQFGEYFGENLNAFDECMRDLYYTWQTTTGFVTVITDAEQFLEDAVSDPTERVAHLTDIVGSFQLIHDDLAVPQDRARDDPVWQPPLTFDVVLVTPPEHREGVTAAWRAAGAPLQPTA